MNDDKGACFRVDWKSFCVDSVNSTLNDGTLHSLALDHIGLIMIHDKHKQIQRAIKPSTEDIISEKRPVSLLSNRRIL